MLAAQSFRITCSESSPMIELHCYYSLSSPWAYFAGPKLQDIVRRHRPKLWLKPYDFQAVVPKTGGVPLRTRPEPRRTATTMPSSTAGGAISACRWRSSRSTIRRSSTDPDWNKYAGWMVIAAQDSGLDALPLSHALLRALWAEERDTADPGCAADRRRERLRRRSAAWRSSAARRVQELYAQFSAEAEELGVFGAPTFVLDGELFWGQDRLDFVDRALDRLRMTAT